MLEKPRHQAYVGGELGPRGPHSDGSEVAFHGLRVPYRRAIYFRPDLGPKQSAAAVRSLVRSVGETCPEPQAQAGLRSCSAPDSGVITPNVDG